MSYPEVLTMTKKLSIAALAIALAGCASTPTSPPKLDLPSTTAQVQPSLAREEDV